MKPNNYERALCAIREENMRRTKARKRHSQALFGHTGAHVRPYVLSLEEVVALTLAVAEGREP